MKFSIALFLVLGFLVQGGAYAADTRDERGSASRKVVASADGAGARKAAIKPCNESDDNCKAGYAANTCGAFASYQQRSGVALAATEAVAARKALDMCGQSECRVVSAGCDH